MRTKLKILSTVCLAMMLSGCFEGHKKVPTDTFCAWSGPHTFSDLTSSIMTDEEAKREAKHSCTWAKICKPRNKSWREICKGIDDA